MDRQEKVIGFIISAFVFFAFIGNIFYSQSINYSSNLYFSLFLLVCSCLIFISCFFKVGKYVQVFVLGFAALLAIITEPLDGFANSVLVLVVILMYRYGMLKKRPIIKFSIYVIIIVLTLLAGSIIMKHKDVYLLPLEGITFFAFFLSALILIFYDEIKVYIRNEKELKVEIDDLNTTMEQTQSYIEKIEAKYVDPVKAGLTEKELGLLKALCLYRESNTQLGKRLGKSPNTVKVQLSKIMDKICVETRHDLINHCRYYFIKNSNKKGEKWINKLKE